MKEKNWSYLAGLIDGEGYIGISRQWRDARNGRAATWEFSPRIHIINCSLKLMTWLIFNFGGNYYSRQKISGWKTSYDWTPKGANNRKTVLRSILPYLVVKQEQAKILLQYLELDGVENREVREQLYLKIKPLNKTGDSVETDTPSTSSDVKIQSELTGDSKSAPVETQGI